MRVAGRPRHSADQFQRSIDNSHLKLQQDPAERVRCAHLLAIVFCVFVVLLGVVALHVKNQNFGYQLTQLRSESADLRVANQKLRLEKARLADPQRIDRLARTDLGLAPSRPQQMVRWQPRATVPPSNETSMVDHSVYVPGGSPQRVSREP